MYGSFTDIESDNSDSEMELHVSWVMLVDLHHKLLEDRNSKKKVTGSVL